jgi:hypothetical protein
VRRPAHARGARGAIFYLDEVVEARKDITVVLHPLADDRRVLPLERTGELLAAARASCWCCQLQPRLPEPAQGPEAQHAPALRGADAGLPGARAGSAIVQAEGGCSAATWPSAWCKLATALRRLTDHDLEETASTRLLVMAARLVALGMPLAPACRHAVLEALSDDGPTLAALQEVQGAVIGGLAIRSRCWLARTRTPGACSACSAGAAPRSSASSPCSWPPRRWTCCASTCTSPAVAAGCALARWASTPSCRPGHATDAALGILLRGIAAGAAAGGRLPGRGLALRPGVLRLAVPALLAGGTAQRPAAPRQRAPQPVGCAGAAARRPPAAAPLVAGVRPAVLRGASASLWASRC